MWQLEHVQGEGIRNTLDRCLFQRYQIGTISNKKYKLYDQQPFQRDEMATCVDKSKRSKIAYKSYLLTTNVWL